MMNYKLFIAAILSFTLIAATPYTDWNLWSNSAETMSIKHPKDWNFNPDFPGMTFSIKTERSDDKDLFREFLTLMAVPVEKELSLENYVDDFAKSTGRSFENMQSSPKSKTTVSGQPAYHIESTGTQMIFELKWRHTIFIKNQQAYILSYTAEEINYDKYLPVVDEMISSFILK